MKAPRVVLAARCEYFRAMFASGMREAASTTVTLEDIEHPVLIALLNHIYTDASDIDPQLALPLFAAADFLGVEHLTQLCVANIESDLSVENVCNVLSVADHHQAGGLKDTCVRYIVEHFRDVHVTEGFRELPRTLLNLVHAGISARLANGVGALGLAAGIGGGKE